MNLDAAFAEIASAMARASKGDGHDLASQAIERNGLIEQTKGAPSQVTVWERVVEGRTLRFKWRWYDPSQAFPSVRTSTF
ncbi:hypothetical protein [Bradyrhizobium lupini]